MAKAMWLVPWLRPTDTSQRNVWPHDTGRNCPGPEGQRPITPHRPYSRRRAGSPRLGDDARHASPGSVTTPRTKALGFYGLAPMHCSPNAIVADYCASGEILRCPSLPVAHLVCLMQGVLDLQHRGGHGLFAVERLSERQLMHTHSIAHSTYKMEAACSGAKSCLKAAQAGRSSQG